MSSDDNNNIVQGTDTSNNIVSLISSDVNNENIGNLVYNDNILNYLAFLQLSSRPFIPSAPPPLRRMEFNSWRLIDTDISNNSLLLPEQAANLLSSLENNNNTNTHSNAFNQILQESMNVESKYKKILSEKGENELKKVIYEKNKYSNDSCVIMHIAFEEGDEITQLPCGHCFNNEGIMHWLKEEKAECPICRKSLDSNEVKKKEEQVNETQENTETQERRRVELINALEQLISPINYSNFENSIINNEEEDDINTAIIASLEEYNKSN